MRRGLRPFNAPSAPCICCPPITGAIARFPKGHMQRQRQLTSTTAPSLTQDMDNIETTEKIEVELPTEVADWLKQMAKAAGISVSQVVAEMTMGSMPNKSGRNKASESMTTLYIMEPIVSLVDGLLEGEHTVSQALSKGNFGLGTLDMLDGEVLVYEGVAYHQNAEGKTVVLSGEERSPFMTMTWHNPSMARLVATTVDMSLEELYDFVTKDCMRSKNVFYSITVDGDFPTMKTRAVRRQASRTRLVDVAKTQALFDLKDESGMLAGFWTPEFMGSSISVPGFHLHYLSKDRKKGGHLLNCRIKAGALVSVQEIHRTKIDMPYREEFLSSRFAGDAAAEIEAAEKEK